MTFRLAFLTAAVCALSGCAVEPIGEPVGTLTGAFSCRLAEPGDAKFDLGSARYEGDINHTGFIAGLRTQGCFGATVEAERGWVVQVRLLQHIDWDIAQVLELNLPIEFAGDEDRLLEAGDVVEMSGDGGFGSMYWIDGAGADPAPLFLGSEGGTVTIDEPAELGPGDWFSGSFSVDMVEL